MSGLSLLTPTYKDVCASLPLRFSDTGLTKRTEFCIDVLLLQDRSVHLSKGQALVPALSLL